VDLTDQITDFGYTGNVSPQTYATFIKQYPYIREVKILVIWRSDNGTQVQYRVRDEVCTTNRI